MKTFSNLPLFLTAILFINTFVGLTQRDRSHWDEFPEPVIDILGNLEKFSDDYSQQKLYLHTDKNSYLAGETIWFSAYLVNAADHSPDASSTNLHVELLDSDSKFINISLIQLQDGYSYGDIHLPDSLYEGNYHIRAYTDWMRNFDKEFYYQKELYVYNPIEENFIRRREIRNKRSYNKELEEKQNKMQFAVFPEGGNMVAGLVNRIAFKATDHLGSGKEASGKVIDSKGNIVYEFFTFHDGMGMFGFIPKAEEKYKAVVNFGDGIKLNYSFPEVLEIGYMLNANIENDQLIIDVTSNFNPADFFIRPEIKVVVHSRGKIIMHEKANIVRKKYQASIPIEKFPGGISHITVFDSNELPIAERLVFINHEDIAQLQINNIKDNSVNNLELLFDGYSDDADDENIFGSYSMAIINPLGNDIDYQSSIASYLLIESDLASTFKNPGYYLSETTDEVKRALDLLMMTHGWRRFNWEKISVGNFPEIEFEHTIGLTISGRLVTAKDSRPLTNIPVNLSVEQDVVDIYSTNTKSGGTFSFEGLHYEGEFNAKIIPEKTTQKAKIDLDVRRYYKNGFSKSFLSRPMSTLSRGDNWSRTSRPDIEVKPFAKPDFKKSSRSPYGAPDQTIYMDDLPQGYNYLNDALRGRMISLGSGGSFQSSTAPLYMIDGNPTSSAAFNSLNPQNVERVEVFSGASTSVFGVRGANGVIIAYPRTRLMDQEPEFVFEYSGYTKNKEFYRSKINTEIYQENNINQTIFWEPQIKPCENGKAEVELPENINLDGKTIIIEGIDNKGRITLLKKEL